MCRSDRNVEENASVIQSDASSDRAASVESVDEDEEGRRRSDTNVRLLFGDNRLQIKQRMLESIEEHWTGSVTVSSSTPILTNEGIRWCPLRVILALFFDQKSHMIAVALQETLGEGAGLIDEKKGVQPLLQQTG